jgi:hypothetical protein
VRASSIGGDTHSSETNTYFNSMYRTRRHPFFPGVQMRAGSWGTGSHLGKLTVWSLRTSSCTGLSLKQYSRKISMVRTMVSLWRGVAGGVWGWGFRSYKTRGKKLS